MRGAVKGMSDSNDKDKLELEFLMEGVTTRMQTAMEKLAESNKTQSAVFLAVIIIVVAGFIIFNSIWLGYVKGLTGGEVVMPDEAQVYTERLPELSKGVDD